MEESRRKICRRCGGPKTQGRGRRYCKECTPLAKQEAVMRWRDSQRGPCEKCGDPKRRGHGQRYCQECYELQKWVQEKKHLYLPTRPCITCKVGKAEKNCLKCYDCRHPVRTCKKCSNPARAKHARYCESCWQESQAKSRAYKKKWDHDNHRRSRYVKKTYTKKQRQDMNELRRLQYRLQNNIKPVSEKTYLRKNGKVTKIERLPIEQLAEVITNWARGDNTLKRLSGMARVDEKNLYNIVNAVKPTVRADIADKTCMALGTTLSLVYTEENQPRPDLVA